MHYILHTMQDS